MVTIDVTVIDPTLLQKTTSVSTVKLHLRKSNIDGKTKMSNGSLWSVANTLWQHWKRNMAPNTQRLVTLRRVTRAETSSKLPVAWNQLHVYSCWHVPGTQVKIQNILQSLVKCKSIVSAQFFVNLKHYLQHRWQNKEMVTLITQHTYHIQQSNYVYSYINWHN